MASPLWKSTCCIHSVSSYLHVAIFLFQLSDVQHSQVSVPWPCRHLQSTAAQESGGTLNGERPIASLMRKSNT